MESTSLIRVVENQCNNTVKFVFKRMPFCSNEEDVVEFTCHRKKNGDYYVMMLPFLGHETPDVKMKFDRWFDMSYSLDILKSKIERFVQWLILEHPYQEWKDVSEFLAETKVKVCLQMFMGETRLISSISNISKQDLDSALDHLLRDYNSKEQKGFTKEDVVFKFRLYI